MTELKPESFLPLSEPAFHVLAALVDCDRHGWAILKEVELRTQGKIRMSPGTLYGVIKRLLEQGLIRESEDRPPRHWDDERRRYYHLTEPGRKVLNAECLRLKEALTVVRNTGFILKPDEA